MYKIENTDLEIGVSGVLSRILFYFEARRCSRQTGSVYTLRINLLNIMIQKTLLKGRGTSIIMKLNESNKEVKNKKKEFTWTRTQDLLVVNSVPKPLDLSVVQCKRFIICISTCKILVKLTVNTESRR